MDWKELPLGSIISSELIRETKYKDGVMYVFEERSVCETPCRARDICSENIFIFMVNQQ
jgi:hypothetical protein